LCEKFSILLTDRKLSKRFNDKGVILWRLVSINTRPSTICYLKNGW
jgi:hypothetical protein